VPQDVHHAVLSAVGRKTQRLCGPSLKFYQTLVKKIIFQSKCSQAELQKHATLNLD
jgi:hypothetical protein